MKHFSFGWFGTDFPANKTGQVIEIKDKKLKFLKRKTSRDGLIYELYEDIKTKIKWNCFYGEGYGNHIDMYQQSDWNMFEKEK